MFVVCVASNSRNGCIFCVCSLVARDRCACFSFSWPRNYLYACWRRATMRRCIRRLTQSSWCIRELKNWALKDVYSTPDGLKLCLEKSGDAIVQSMFTMAGKQTTMSRTFWCFHLAETVIVCGYSFPGMFHDSTVAKWGGVYNKFGEFRKKCGGKCVVNLTFCRGFYPYL